MFCFVLQIFLAGVQFKYVDSETFNQAVLIQFIDNDSDFDFLCSV